MVILDGTFLDRLQKSSEGFEERLTEEAFTDLIATYRPTREGGDWKGRLKAAKRPLASDLSYNAINLWSVDARYFTEQAQLVATHRELACRLLYVLLSFIAIAFDFVMKDLAFSEPATKLAMLNDGLRHGSRGPTGTQQLVQLAMGLIEHYAPENRALAPRIKEKLAMDLDHIPTRMLAEYFGKPSVSQELFSVAKELEAAAYKVKFVAPQSLSAGARGMMGVFLDFWGMDRARFFGVFEAGMTPQAASGAVIAARQPSPTKEEKDVKPQVTLPGLKVD